MTSDGFEALDDRIRRWIFKQGWSDLRDIQKAAIAPILSADRDVIISAATAAGKTEAFFLPACSAVADATDGFVIIYISPLKALINDQYRRLESLCECLDMSLTPWHGDSPQSKKNKVRRNPSGILLITPESLESMLMRRAGWAAEAFSSLRYVVIDEFHAFIGLERGQHLLSLLNRLEVLLARDHPIPRVALSATLGDLDSLPGILRPSGGMPITQITSDSAVSHLRLQIRGYLDPTVDPDLARPTAESLICNDIFKICRGDSHLVFANSRRRTEALASRLSDLCEEQVVPNEFFPHHGSLSKELRESLEARLQKGALPTTALCTTTLELGIDIGKVKSIAQITPPHSVASLRQRLGRSGRRDEPATLRIFIAEDELHSRSGLVDRLRLQLLQSIAMTRLLLRDKWYEPPDTSQFHFSTLLHQVLATVAQWGGVRADQLFHILCVSGPFGHVDVPQFKTLLRHMGKEELLIQLQSGEFTLGLTGERVTGHYSFYAAFQTPEEYRIVAAGRTLGSLPIESMVLPGQHIVFAGKRWRVDDIHPEGKSIHVSPTKGGVPPKFGGEGMRLHDRIRQEMFSIYKSGSYGIGQGSLEYLDGVAQQLFSEGLNTFNELRLFEEYIIETGRTVAILPWRGDKIVATLAALLIQRGLKASTFAGTIEVEDVALDKVRELLRELSKAEACGVQELAQLVPDTRKEKFDEFLPQDLVDVGYGARFFDIAGTRTWLNEKFN